MRFQDPKPPRQVAASEFSGREVLPDAIHAMGYPPTEVIRNVGDLGEAGDHSQTRETGLLVPGLATDELIDENAPHLARIEYSEYISGLRGLKFGSDHDRRWGEISRLPWIKAHPYDFEATQADWLEHTEHSYHLGLIPAVDVIVRNTFTDTTALFAHWTPRSRQRNYKMLSMKFLLKQICSRPQGRDRVDREAEHRAVRDRCRIRSQRRESDDSDIG